jgi:hypothetical protein
LKTKQSELVTAIASIEPTAEAAIETSKQVIETKNSEIKKSSTIAFGDLKKQIRSIEQNGILTIQKIVSETHDKLDEAIKTSEESTKALVQGLEDEHKTALSSYRSSTTQEIDSYQNSIESYRTTLKDKFIEFFTEGQKISDHYIDQIRIDREELDNQRRNVDVRFDEVHSNFDSSFETFNSSINANIQNTGIAAKNITKTTKNIVKSLR